MVKYGIIIVPFSFFTHVQYARSSDKKKKNLTSEKVRFNVKSN